MRELTENLPKLIAESGVLVLQFGDAACAPCHAIRHKLDLWLKENENVIARYIDIPSHLELCAQMDIFSAPTVIVYMDGQVAARESGYFSLEAILERVERYLELSK